VSDDAHVFGGPWTEQKLAILGEYLSRYSTALKNQKFKKGYIDAFAGTGYRENTATAKAEQSEHREVAQSTLPEMTDSPEPLERFLDGSARVALQCDPEFDRYVFIEKSTARCQELKRLKIQFPNKAGRIFIKRGDAIDEIQSMCKKDWAKHRAVLFLDPYGMQVQWKTIEAIANTRAVDLWVLFPLGGVNRMLTQSGEIPPEWRNRLDELLGTTDWHEHFYQIEETSSLFNERIERVVKARIEVISEYFLARLRSCFAGVAPNPMVLRNSKNSPLYLFCFAAGNPNGSRVALKIASHVLKMGL
jgi:three-Cys-motif partner protein